MDVDVEDSAFSQDERLEDTLKVWKVTVTFALVNHHKTCRKFFIINGGLIILLISDESCLNDQNDSSLFMATDNLSQ